MTQILELLPDVQILPDGYPDVQILELVMTLLNFDVLFFGITSKLRTYKEWIKHLKYFLMEPDVSRIEVGYHSLVI
ncbi:hypothetical protein Tco_1181080 [Tanacetum coccineum]